MKKQKLFDTCRQQSERTANIEGNKSSFDRKIEGIVDAEKNIKAAKQYAALPKLSVIEALKWLMQFPDGRTAEEILQATGRNLDFIRRVIHLSDGCLFIRQHPQRPPGTRPRWFIDPKELSASRFARKAKLI